VRTSGASRVPWVSARTSFKPDHEISGLNDWCIGGTGAGAPFICEDVERRNLFEVSLNSGQLISWAPAFDSPVGLLVAAVDQATHALWAGGDFGTVNKQAVANLASFPCAG
jgi:hypothetical protein